MKRFLLTALISSSLWSLTSLFFASLQLPTVAQTFLTGDKAPLSVLTSTNDPGSDGLTIANSIMVGGTDYFLSIGNSPGLYKTDGTSSGTVHLSSLSPAYPYDLVDLSGTLFFEATDSTHGTELYKSDGTVSGTVLVKDIQSGYGSSSPSGLTVLGRKVYFSADDGTSGQELWLSDGTSDGTSRAANIKSVPVTTGVSTPDRGSHPSFLQVMSKSLYFAADDGVHGNELWQYNGTTASLVKDLYPGNDIDGKPFASGPTNLAVNGSNFYFSAYTPTTGQDLFKSDGTTAGTVVVDINAGAADSNPSRLTVMGGNLYTAATDATHGTELFKVSGSTPTLVNDLYPGSTGSQPEALTAIGSTLWFTAQKSTSTGYEVFRTDGTNILNSGNPWDINSGAGSSNAGLFTQVGSDVYFIADNGTNGYELFKSASGTGTPALVKNINTTLTSTVPGTTTDVGAYPTFIQPLSGSNFVFFAALNDIGNQLYKSDGTSTGTVLVKKLDTTARVAPSLSLSVDGTATGKQLSLRFAPTTGQELYVYDPSAGTTTLLADINPGPSSSQVADVTVFNGKSYFTAFDGKDSHLWQTDGTSSGTVKVSGATRDIHRIT